VQFGKAVGYALISLGLLLVVLEVYLIFGAPVVPPNAGPAAAGAPPPSRRDSYIPLISGLVSLAAGGYLLTTQRKRGNMDEIQPAKTKSGLPM
jgi:hypothetical protein